MKKPFAPGKPAPRRGSPPMDARRLALNALCDVTRASSYAHLALNKQLSGCTLSPEDRRLATSIFYTALENRIRLSHVLSQFVHQVPEPIIEDILHIGAAQLLLMDKIPDHAAVDSSVKQVKALGREGSVAFVNGTLRNLIRARDAGTLQYPDKALYPVRHLSVMYSLPEPIVKLLIDEMGYEQAEALIAYRPTEHTQTIRPNLLHFDVQSFEEYAKARGWALEKATVPGAYHLKAGLDLGADEGFKSGKYSLISEPSMLAAYALQPKRGQNLLDACAAPGGKAALLCELLMGSGRVYAWDSHEHRVALLRATQARLHLDNLRPALRDARVHRDDLDMTFSGVLIDAPCSGLGTMLGKPDIKYRMSIADIGELAKIQREILDACAPYVAVGGLLVYSTCTITKAENEDQVASFLLRHPEYQLETDASYLPESLRARASSGMLQLLPNVDHMEGFFIARLRRTEAL